MESFSDVARVSSRVTFAAAWARSQSVQNWSNTSWTGHDVMYLEALAFCEAVLLDRLMGQCRLSVRMLYWGASAAWAWWKSRFLLRLFGHDRNWSRIGLQAAVNLPGDVRSRTAREALRMPLKGREAWERLKEVPIFPVERYATSVRAGRHAWRQSPSNTWLHDVLCSS